MLPAAASVASLFPGQLHWRFLRVVGLCRFFLSVMSESSIDRCSQWFDAFNFFWLNYGSSVSSYELAVSCSYSFS